MPPQVRLYTWLDVEDTLLQALEARSGGEQSWFVDATAYWDRLVVRVRPGNESQAERWLRELFDPRTTPPERELEIVLESSDGQERRLPVAIEAAEGPDVRGRATPSFARPSFIRREREPLEPPELPPGSPPIFAMHSFKGGVGRTIHALALARVIAEERGRALLVDADLEAPGITWLLETRLAAPPIAFADVLALVHGDPDPAAEASIQLVADRLYGASLDNLFVLPAFRSSGAFHSLEIRPEHLLLGRKDPFVLSNTLTKLGSALGVDAIVVDLRAGLSEIAAGLLLDPRVYRVLVTTMSGQSVNGTELVLDLLARRARSLRQDHPVPVVLLNQVPVDFRGTDVLAQVEERLLAAVSRTVDKEEEIVASDVLRGPTWFDASLLMLPGNWDEALGLTRRDAIQNTIRPLADFVPSRKAALAERPAPDREEQRKALAQTATRLIFAEAGGVEEFLPISPLRRLVADHRAQVPIAVVVGAKGAGKTYTYLQVVRRRTWRHFAEAAGETETSVAPLLCPVLQPKNLGGSAQEILTSCRQGTARELALGEPLNAVQIEDKVRGWLKEDLHEGEWRERWLDLMAWTTAFRVNEPGAGRHLAEYLATRRQVLLFPFDGIEDLFQDLLSSEPQQRALRALLQDVPNWLEQQPGRRVGALVFVRRDMVAIAVRQNVAQLLARYDSYTLKWDSTEALRLAWIPTRSPLPNRSGPGATPARRTSRPTAWA